MRNRAFATNPLRAAALFGALFLAASGAWLAAGDKTPAGPVARDASGWTYTAAGELLDTQWAHGGDRLAVCRRENGRTQLVIVDAPSGRLTFAYWFPRSKALSCLAWEHGDKAIVVAAHSTTEDPPVDAFYRLSLAARTLKPAYRQVEPLYAKTTSLFFDGSSTRWAAGYRGEGHPDVALYQDGKELLQTGVFPFRIEGVGWTDGKFLCATDCRLDQGLSVAEREKAFGAVDPLETGTKDFEFYSIDPGTAKAEKETKWTAEAAKAWLARSASGAYTLSIEEKDGSFQVRVAKTAQ